MDIKSLHPADDTSAAARDALDRITAAMAETEGKITEASGRRETLMTEGSVKEIRKAEQDLADARLDLDRLKLLAERVQEQATAAEAAERKAKIAADHAELAAKIADHVAELDRILPKVAKQLRELIARNSTLQAECGRVNALTSDRPELPPLDPCGEWLLGGLVVPETRTERAEWEAAVEAKRAEEQRELRDARFAQAEAMRRRFEEHGAAEREREAAPKLESAGRVEFAPN